jgi:hypothetical protein
MNANPLDRAINSAAGAPLDARQKARICAVARAAWETLNRPGFDNQSADLPDAMRLSETEAFTLWRQHEQGLACGHEHLTACQQRHFADLMRHFCAMVPGEQNSAAWWGSRGIENQRRQARHALELVFGEVSDVIDRPEAYATSICRTRYRCEIADASARQLWVLTFDLRRNAQRRRGRNAVAPLRFVGATVPSHCHEVAP